LTYIAISFIPLTFVSGIFSMSGPFAPGERFFWVYFEVAVPLAAGLLLVVIRDLAVSVLYAPRIMLWRK
jgi:Mg2+ and Co2+ transporter CorA